MSVLFDMIPDEVTCTKCNAKPVAQFPRFFKWPRSYHCHDCLKEDRRRHHRVWRETGRTRAYAESRRDVIRDQMLRRSFGITKKEYDAMLAAQGGVCAICKQPEILRTHRNGSNALRFLAVDHDHKTGQVRGLLCSGCNVGIGAFRENQERMVAAIRYLQSWA